MPLRRGGGWCGLSGDQCEHTVQVDQADRGEGIDQAVQRLVARAYLLPLEVRTAEAVAGNQLLGGQLGEVFVVEGIVDGEMDVARAGVLLALRAVPGGT